MVGRSPGAEVLGDLVTLSRVGVVANLSDAQLLDRFLFLQGESAKLAFEALVCRHGPMVLDVCLCIPQSRRRPGRFSSNVLRAGFQGKVDPPTRLAGQLA